MADQPGISAHFLGCLERAEATALPFRHWLLNDVLPADAVTAIDDLPFAPAAIGDTLGKRETSNTTRIFVAGDRKTRFAVCGDLAGALQGAAVTRRLEALCGIDLAGSFLRIEYCLDSDGFWLEPHTDIGAKLFTMLIYLSAEPGSERWGTDLYDGDLNRVETAPYRRGCGLIFIPAADTWHGFEKRPIAGLRRSLIVNYVKPEWRSRHELAFPDRAIAGP